jgi:hypothetical protein
MPKRVIDFDAMWASDKIAACADWAQAEYAWLYGLADCAGCFELTNLRVVWGRVAAIRKSFSMERLEQVLDEFQDKGLLFVWNESGKRYGHWTGSDVPGRLPPPSWRNRLERLAPAVPREQFAKYVAAHSAGVKNRSRCEPMPDGTSAACGGELPRAKVESANVQSAIEFDRGVTSVEPVGLWRDERSANWSGAKNTSMCPPRRASSSRNSIGCESAGRGVRKACLEEPQAQDLGLDLDQEGNRERQIHTHDALGTERVCESTQNSFEEEQNQKKMPFEENIRATAEETAKPINSGRNSANPLRSSLQATASPETLREIWEQERGSLGELRALSPEREARCRERLAHARKKGKDIKQFLSDFREAVARAAKTPFCCGAGPGGWIANFDWLVANDTNYLKVLEGRYDSGAGISGNGTVAPNAASGPRGFSARAGSWAAHARARDESVRRELHTGAGPASTQNSARVRAGVVDRALHRV